MAKQWKTEANMALQEKRYRVITIEATEKPEKVKLRVAAYARVSSASDDQLNSFAAQNQYYTTLISSKEEWSMVDIYADEGITGTSAEKRGDFQRLLADCRRGLIDRVLVKSISRFARNAKECLETIRELKSLGVGVCFEKEHINTATMSGEMMTALFASFAQAESESISGNMRWSYQRRMQSGQFITCKAPFGYRLKNGTLEVEPDEAKIVRQIFNMYLSGYNQADIAAEITRLGIPSRDGKQYWQKSSISYVLQNERYTGNALLQKKYTTSTLPYQKKLNKGEKDQYFVTGSNQPIISQEIFDAAQALMHKRAQKIVTGTENVMPLAMKLQCGCCGALFKKKQHLGEVYWTCRTHEVNKEGRAVKQIPQTAFYNAFCRLYYNLKQYGNPILNARLTSLQTIRNRRMLWSSEVQKILRRLSRHTATEQMEQQVLSMLNGLIASPSHITCPESENPPKTPERALQMKLNAMMEQETIDEDAAQKLALAIAAAQYSAIDPNQYETVRIRKILSEHKIMTELDAELLQSSVSDIQYCGDGSVSIRLKNHQLIERSETV